MYYIDTSVLAAYYCPENLSEKVQSFLTAQINPAISSLTDVELYSAISKKVSMGELSHADGNRIISKFQSHLDGSFFRVIPIESEHWRIARGWLSLFNTPLRALDALHLAVSSSEQLIIIATDRQLLEAAKTLGVQCENIITAETK
jgi:predicted nucleic acid-binding protein